MAESWAQRSFYIFDWNSWFVACFLFLGSSHLFLGTLWGCEMSWGRISLPKFPRKGNGSHRRSIRPIIPSCEANRWCICPLNGVSPYFSLPTRSWRKWASKMKNITRFIGARVRKVSFLFDESRSLFFRLSTGKRWGPWGIRYVFWNKWYCPAPYKIRLNPQVLIGRDLPILSKSLILVFVFSAYSSQMKRTERVSAQECLHGYWFNWRSGELCPRHVDFLISFRGTCVNESSAT